jgi:Fe-S cluster assembly iron-binding protein IscA
LTENASTVVKSIAAQNPDVTGAGLRIAAIADDNTELNLSVVSAPEETDNIVEVDGALVFLEPVASGMLDDKVLDARVEDNGAVSFALGVQA